jgi:hypothetical protein
MSTTPASTPSHLDGAALRLILLGTLLPLLVVAVALVVG